jgi:tetratricopeptide (TPR) repeat protein
VPPGSASIDAYVFDQPNSDAFLQKVDNNGGRFYFSREGSIENTRQGVIEIDDIKQGTVYLGLKNPSTLDGVNVVIEVAAVVEEVQQLSVQQSEAVTYGDLAWKAFQRGDYDRCLQLSFKSLEFDNTLGYVHFNIGLAYLVKGFNNDALDYYTKAIALTHKSSVPKGTFEGAIQDLKSYMGLFPSQTDAQDILAILQGEARKY